jgi:light-harvesting protein B-800-850 alpha chain
MATHNPDNDYKFWLVVNPATWLVPIFLALLAVAVIVHVTLYQNARYDILAGPATAAAVK